MRPTLEDESDPFVLCTRLVGSDADCDYDYAARHRAVRAAVKTASAAASANR
ncbi:hypothetical protein Sgleb_07570 [Streptomyces glebosus]|uniref:Uncharacterized protein n=1 Tax=Streptomyces glebosus TaxID=249580 RepID=A0A640SNZ5_9ACTN|nr:hypothetical protein Sgleb_07570 [Streptomyces glebosus]GHG75025.1 hypothetical protein GCM10010513_49270 [Streptomyces glebosus]